MSMQTLSEKIILVTGAAGGIGHAACVELARRGARVIASARNEARAREAVEAIQRDSGSRAVEPLACDLGDLASVRAAAADVARRFDRLDALGNNAAVFSRDRKTTRDGFEYTVGGNHLGTFLLTNLLLELIKRAPAGRIVTLSVPPEEVDFADLQSEKSYKALKAYLRSKTALQYMTRELARRLEGTRVVATAVHPGLTRSKLPSEAPAPLRLVFKLFGARPADAAQVAVELASGPLGADHAGALFIKGKPEPRPAFITDEAAARLWRESARLVGLDA